jgi:hypothetical protein
MGRSRISGRVCIGSERVAVWIVAEGFGVIDDVTSKKNE